MRLKFKMVLDDDTYDFVVPEQLQEITPYICAEGLDSVFRMRNKSGRYYKRATLVVSDRKVRGAVPIKLLHGTDAVVLDLPHSEEWYISIHTRRCIEEAGMDLDSDTVYWVWVEL